MQEVYGFYINQLIQKLNESPDQNGLQKLLFCPVGVGECYV